MKLTVKSVQKLSSKVYSWLKAHPMSLTALGLLTIFWRQPFTYFEQDEWMVFGQQILISDQPITNCLTIQRPLVCLVNRASWSLFSTNAWLYGIASLLLIFCLSLAIYHLYRRFKLKPVVSAMLAIAVWLPTNGGHSATWFGSFLASVPCQILAILSLNSAIDFLEQKKFWNLAKSALFLLLALYFKEEALWVVVPLLALPWLLRVKLGRLSFNQGRERFIDDLKAKPIWSFWLVILVIVASFLFIEQRRQAKLSSFSQLISSTEPAKYRTDLIKTFFLLPFDHLGQTLIPNQMTVDWAVKSIAGTDRGLTRTIIAISRALSVALIILIGIGIWQAKPERKRLYIWLSLWGWFGFISYIIFGKNPEVLELRYYFASQLALGPLVALIVSDFWQNRQLKTLGSKIIPIVAIGLAVVLVGLNLSGTNARQKRAYSDAKERRLIFKTIKEALPVFKNNQVILLESSVFGYNGSAYYLAPFFSGPGYSLMVLYQNQELDFRPFFQKIDFWDWVSQGFIRHDQTGFGYFRDYGELERAYQRHEFSIDDVHAFYYDYHKVENRTSSVREQLGARFEPRKAIEIPDGTIINTSLPGGAAPGFIQAHLSDKKLDTRWVSYHNAGEYIELVFPQTINSLSGIKMFTSNPNDHIKKYNLYFAEENGEYQLLPMHTGGSSQPDLSILFRRRNIKRLKVEQADTLATSSNWVINELQLFQAE
ncbi:MAG: Uncharacterized protein CEO22_235 [Candidatus Berkelbacteria bacterium Gr01-1014_85]|uniref:Uncharacterized protein n=1 Tax=Candidatus Berkelbacteria bacterium Gr01-1014_85 TaxID=2017150 RepID=A0A554JCT3_9BACT|nr:MAG: Uncharacterized protein CEO22_235 [Candidatus Berkelbacteria bacterium Gr01-1014_85]